MNNEIPRRFRIDQYIPAETAIRAAVLEVEALGAHEQLTRASTLLDEAQRLVADWHDSGRHGAFQAKAKTLLSESADNDLLPPNSGRCCGECPWGECAYPEG